MEQKELRDLERRCIQEEPAFCTAACPLHVDAKALCGSISRGDWNGAWGVLNKTMPLPGVLARICDAPCEAECIRKDAGGSIRVGLLEKTLTGMPAPRRRVVPFPSKGKRICIVGGGLSGLTAAWDLCKKGFGITLLEAGEAPGGALLQAHPGELTPEVVEAEIALLTSLGVEFRTGADWGSTGFLDKLLEEYDAVYLCLEAIGRPSCLPGMAGGEAGARFRLTERERVAAGGDSPSPVVRAAQGRAGALSLERVLQKVLLEAGRDREGPFATRLFTSLEGVEARPPTSPFAAGTYSPEEAREEAGRCIQCQCLECVKVCAYLERFKGYPKKYAREIYNNESIVMGTRASNKLVDSCSLCGLCERVCPNDFAMQDLCLGSRRSMVKRGKMPPSAHEFALLDMAFGNGPDFRLARHQPGRDASAWAFFPGCQLAASDPQAVRRVYDYLASRLPDGVGLMLGCCGAPAAWSGRDGAADEAAGAWRVSWEELGRPKMVTACSSCQALFKARLPEVPLESLWETLARVGPPEGARAPQGPLVVHDPCSSRYEEGVRGAVRSLAGGLGAELKEISLSGEFTECCGYGGLMHNANPPLGREVARRRAERSPQDYLAYCAMCRDSLAREGKRVSHLLDWLFPPAGGSDPADRPRPGWSRRRENRRWLKSTLLRELWGGEPEPMEDWRKVELILEPGVAEKLEERRILLEDIQRAVLVAEAGGKRLKHPETGLYKASARLGNIVLWMDYLPDGQAYRIHRAYAHRMEVKAR